jgi:hypothetical protein
VARPHNTAFAQSDPDGGRLRLLAAGWAPAAGILGWADVVAEILLGEEDFLHAHRFLPGAGERERECGSGQRGGERVKVSGVQ